MSLPLFDLVSSCDASSFSTSIEAPKQADRSDVRRVIEHKAGPFKEVLGGKETGREFRILELHSGQIIGEWVDGARFRLPASVTSIYISDGLHYKTLVEVRL